jgi:type II secretory pathway component PulM
MMLTTKAPAFAVCGHLSDILPTARKANHRKLLHAYLLKRNRRRRLTAHLRTRARRASRARLVAMTVLLLAAFAFQCCAQPLYQQPEKNKHTSPAWRRLSFNDPEPAQPDSAVFKL